MAKPGRQREDSDIAICAETEAIRRMKCHSKSPDPEAWWEYFKETRKVKAIIAAFVEGAKWQNTRVQSTTVAQQKSVAAIDWCEHELRRYQNLADECDIRNDQWGVSIHRTRWNLLEQVIGKLKMIAKDL
jgi:hypothetical protein